MQQQRAAKAVTNMQTAMNRALILLNPSVDKCSPAEIRESIAERMEPKGWSCEVVEVSSLEQLDAEAAAAPSLGYDMVVVAGGNGTIARVARHLAGTDLKLGIIPVGRDNSLSLDLGIPPESNEAVDLLAGEHDAVYLDALRVGDRHFFLQVGTAVETPATRAVPGAAAERAALGSRARKAFGFEPHRFTLLADGQHYRVGAWQVVAVNTGSAGSELLRSGPPIHPADGAAELVVFQIRSVLDLLRSGFGLLRRHEDHAIDVSYHRFRDRVLIAPDLPMPVQGDGEPIGSTPLEINVVPKSVQVAVPRGAPVVAPGVGIPHTAGRRHRRKSGWFRAALLHRLGPVGVVDTALFVAISQMPHPGPVNLLMQCLEVGMSSGRGWIAGTIAANLLRGRRPWADLVNLVPSLWVSSLLTEYPIKEVFARPRPFASVVMTPVVGRKPSSHSFPSGHSASAFAGAWLLSRRYPRLAPAFYGFATLVGFSRVYQGHHYPSDVVIGAAAGTGLAAVYRATLGDLVARLARRRV